MEEINGNLEQLVDSYLQADDETMALFLGAGVNLPSGNVKVQFNTYSWPALVEALFEHYQSRLSHSFDELWPEHKNNWIAYADYLYARIDEDELIDQVDRLFYSTIPRKDKTYRRLSKRFWDQAPTLQAAVGFCTELKPLTPKKTSWRFRRSRKIGKVITTNYDYFFGAGWTRYEGFYDHWKVDTPFSSREPKAGQAPIEYIHGYLPYVREEGKKSETKGIVLSQDKYDEFYQPGEFAEQALRDSISNYSLIFVGISLTDPPLVEMLKEIPLDERPPHFAIIKRGKIRNAAELGVKLIEFDDYAQVKKILKRVYCSGVTPEIYEHYGFENSGQYWERLLKGKPKK
jgi:hypothetical protein